MRRAQILRKLLSDGWLCADFIGTTDRRMQKLVADGVVQVSRGRIRRTLDDEYCITLKGREELDRHAG